MAKRIALFGGSFNPPHIAHQLACAVVLASRPPAVDELWLVPTYQHAFDKELAPFADRVAMCERAARLFAARVKVCTIEETLPVPSYTLTTIEALQTTHPDVQFVLALGSDLLLETHAWHDWDKIKSLVEIYVVGRDGYKQNTPGIALPPVSSTAIRQRYAQGLPPEPSTLDHRVADYIRERGLYGSVG